MKKSINKMNYSTRSIMLRSFQSVKAFQTVWLKPFDLGDMNTICQITFRVAMRSSAFSTGESPASLRRWISPCDFRNRVGRFESLEILKLGVHTNNSNQWLSLFDDRFRRSLWVSKIAKIDFSSSSTQRLWVAPFIRNKLEMLSFVLSWNWIWNSDSGRLAVRNNWSLGKAWKSPNKL